MKGALWLCLLLATFAPACRARPDSRQPGSRPGPEQPPQKSRRSPPALARQDLLGALSQDQKYLMAKYLPHIYAELANREGYWHEDDTLRPLHHRDYPGWMDFGRRSLADAGEAS
ncbi:gastrin [Carettochelys insculpta]|uniref:gastrin n=1 Tax=Carettochelys insculpta TaxID=44489 RepID=UPI003EC028CC